ncbi:MAG: LysR family transcriptional regulator [Hyphomicrobiaceae bacterium]|nr:LysR family transcriptional regulator [Hyphomicrobiaceae bacterium]
MMSPALDLDAVAAFVRIADLGSFTRAAESLDTQQAAVSQKLKRLEQMLDCRLLERTPRRVGLTEHGARFLEPARELLAASARAAGALQAVPRQQLRIGISDHVAGRELPELIGRLNAMDRGLVMEFQIGKSREMEVAFEAGHLDAAVIRREGARQKGRGVMEDRVGWFASPRLRWHRGEPLPLANLSPPCGLRTLALRAIDAAGVRWVEVFSGGGVMAVGAAVTAGIAVAPLAARVAPVGAVDVTEAFGLPRLPASKVIALSRVRTAQGQAAMRVLLAGFRSAQG